MAKKSKKPTKKAAKKKAAPKKKSAKKSIKKAKKPAKKKAVKKVAKKKAAPKKKATKKKAAPKKAAKKPAVKTVVKRVVKTVVKKVEVKAPAPKPSVALNPYLTFAGNCEEAFNFYKSVFGGNFQYIGRFGEMPPMEGHPAVPDSEKNKIMHMSLPIGNNSVLMGSDSSDAFGHATVMGNNFSISINATSKAEADKLYNALAAGGNPHMPMSNTFWGSYFGMLVDKFGIAWMMSYDDPKAKK